MGYFKIPPLSPILRFHAIMKGHVLSVLGEGRGTLGNGGTSSFVTLRRNYDAFRSYSHFLTPLELDVLGF